jgi:hypothetical protein
MKTYRVTTMGAAELAGWQEVYLSQEIEARTEEEAILIAKSEAENWEIYEWGDVHSEFGDMPIPYDDYDMEVEEIPNEL